MQQHQETAMSSAPSSETTIYAPSAEAVKNAYISGMGAYDKLRAEAAADHEEIGRASCRERV